MDTEEYQRALLNIQQGKRYARICQTNEEAAEQYRKIGWWRISSAAIRNWKPNAGPTSWGSMARHILRRRTADPIICRQLSETYGGRVHTEDLSMLTEPLATETITVNGKRYTASYFGEEDISKISGYKTRKFWRLENAYQDFKDLPTTGEVMAVTIIRWPSKRDRFLW